ncbi:hypothetical protein V7161_16260 [Neobacillus drentensis]|uniref:hypothetical protein n=1 Tax=Neobacillus drentensis TaxID=220684 RepID=UPI00300138B7
MSFVKNGRTSNRIHVQPGPLSIYKVLPDALGIEEAYDHRVPEKMNLVSMHDKPESQSFYRWSDGMKSA